MKIFLGEGAEAVEAGVFEPAGISPWNMKSGPGSADKMGSEDYAHHSNAMAMADFISNIGDKNTLTLKKVRCPSTEIFMEAKRDNESLAGVNFYVTPLWAVAKGSRGNARLESIHKNSLEMVTLRSVICTDFWTVHYTKSNNSKVVYDYVTLEAEKVGKFLFKGKDW